MTNHDDICLELIGKTGTTEAYSIVVERVRVRCLRLIVDRYGIDFIHERITKLEHKFSALAGVIEAMAQASTDDTLISESIRQGSVLGGLEASKLARALATARES